MCPRTASIGSEAALSSNTDVHRLPDYVREMQRDLAFAHGNISDRVRKRLMLVKNKMKISNPLLSSLPEIKSSYTNHPNPVMVAVQN